MIKKFLLGAGIVFASVGIASGVGYADVLQEPTADMEPLTMYGIDGKKIDSNTVYQNGEYVLYKTQTGGIIRKEQAFNYPIKSVEADFTRLNKNKEYEITQKTTKVRVTFDGTINRLNPSDGSITASTWLLLLRDQEDRLTYNGIDKNELGSVQMAWPLNSFSDGKSSFPVPSNQQSEISVKDLNPPKAGEKVWIGSQTQFNNSIYYLTRQEWQNVSKIDLQPTLDTIVAGSTTLSGTGTQVGDTITISIDGTDQAQTDTVDPNGNWQVDLDSLPAGAKVVATESNDYGDTPGKTDEQIVPGELKFATNELQDPNSSDATNPMHFKDTTLTTGDIKVTNPMDTDGNPWGVYVYDSRGADADPWYVDATSDGNLTDEKTHSLVDALKYKPSGQDEQSFVNNNPILLFTNDKNKDAVRKTTTLTDSSTDANLPEYVTKASFDNSSDPDAGILIHPASTADIYTGSEYTGTINLTLTDAPH